MGKTMTDVTGILIRSRMMALVGLLLLGGCASVGFRRGGSAEAFNAASRRCESQQSPAYVQCMKAAGWQTSTSSSTAAPTLSGPQKPGASASANISLSGTITAGSWWKLGGDTADLAKTRLTCGAGEGPQFLRTTVACMEKKGWFPAGR
jgi:hypothetical protein